MIEGLRGSLLSHDALEASGLNHPPSSEDWQHVSRAIATWHAHVAAEWGPAWPARRVFDRVAVPLCAALGLEVMPARDVKQAAASVFRHGQAIAVLVALPWGEDASAAWRDSVLLGIAASTRWCYCFAGPSLRVFDAHRTYSRRYVEFDLSSLATNPSTRAVAWRILGSCAADALDRAVVISESHRLSVRASLQSGVHDALTQLTGAFRTALRDRRPSNAHLLDESLVVVYRMLFLLFAEARGLVPLWHPVYRDSYAVEAMRDPIERYPRPRGLWSGIQALARLAHDGCRAGALRVPPFNGRLFSPAHAPLAESAALDDAAVRRAMLELTTRRTPDGRRRIAYGDLGVEHLGGVYERVLDYDIRSDRRGITLVSSGRRKSSGSFYTPRALTEYLVRRTLRPLVADAGSRAILRLRVLDPSMGSGAFLVAACRYLAGAYESALIAEGVASPADVSEADRAGFRRLVAQRTLFGVDINPMAVQLARLSLWLATLSADRPLTFFDHHLRTGNSLVGARLRDVASRRSGRSSGSAMHLPLFDDGFDGQIGTTVAAHLSLVEGREDTREQVRLKEMEFARIHAPGAPLDKWKALLDLWCAGWFDDTVKGTRPTIFAAIADSILGRAVLPERSAHRLLERGRAAAAREHFFHWELEFPEIFYTASGAAASDPGFDAVIGNPPWEMLRGDAHGTGRRLTSFARESGTYRLHGGGHANLYQIFLERSLSLARRCGRIGLVLPSGFATDHGCAPLRRHMLDSTEIDSLVAAENTEALFPIHRGLKFLLLTATNRQAGGTQHLPLRSGVRSADEFDRLPDDGRDPAAVAVPRTCLERLTGEQLAIPDLRTSADVAIASRLSMRFPAASDPAGWGLKFGRELNATDDRRHFTAAGGLPVIEGKHLQPFVVDTTVTRNFVSRESAAALMPARTFERPRLAYRDVASSTNRITLIAAVLPAGTVTTHTLFCSRSVLDGDALHFLAGLFNSFVANYLIRMRVTTHVTVAIVERLPLPSPERASRPFVEVTRRARRLAARTASADDAAVLQGVAARLYELHEREFAHVLSTFPLVEKAVRDAAMDAFLRTI